MEVKRKGPYMTPEDERRVYRCPNCAWQGTRYEMESEDYDDFYCTTICPKCKRWYELEEYEVVGGR